MMKMKHNTVQMLTRSKMLAIATVMLVAAACAPKQQIVETPPVNTSEQLSNQLVQSVLWYQSSVERKMIYAMSFKRAEQLLKQNMQKYGKSKKQLAVVVDIDETILDNSPYEGYLIKNQMAFTPETWQHWVNKAKADLLPGSRDFLTKVEQSGIEIFYISNRSMEDLEPTMQNLRMHELPFIDPGHIMLKTDLSSKTDRKKVIQESYKIILSVGDQYSDFDSEGYALNFEVGMEQANYQLADSVLNHFVLLPNPMYGEFEKMIAPNRDDVSTESKLEMRAQAIKGMN